jgi:Ca2+-transporting ATPase
MWHKLDVKEVYAKLSTSDKGLADKEAQLRLERYGYNELKEKKKTTSLQLFLNQFKNFLIFILIVAMLVSLFLGEIVDAAAIGTILMLNAFFGFYQERKAEHALEALKKIAAPRAKVVRAGQTTFLPARELVPGDVILLEAGDKVPADSRIIEELNLKIDEAVLTGESVAAKKTAAKVSKDAIPERKNIAFSGTTVVYGYCKAIVIATAMETEFGKIAKVLQEKEDTTPLQKKLEHLGRQLGVAVLAITAIIFAAGYLHGIELVEMFLVSVSLAVAAIPEGLPAIVTITLSIGLLRLARKNAIVRKLSAAEALGSTTVICTDKTGTLTVNQMTVRKLYVNESVIDVTGEGYDISGKFLLNKKEVMNDDIKALLKTGMLCNNAVLGKESIGDPTEIALLVSARKSGMNDLRKEYKKLDEVPFESERKMMSTLYEGDGKTMYTKGAVEELLKRCEFVYRNGKKERMTTKDRKDIIDTNHEFALSSLRVLAFAMKTGGEFKETDLTFVGLQGMIDPPRPEVKQAIAKCKDAGINVVMTTGDHKDTAVTIAREIGILDKGKVLTGEELEKKK